MTIMKTKKGSLVWSFKHRPPLSMTIIGSVLLLLMSSKGIVIDKLPITDASKIELLGNWYTYVLELLGVIVALLNIVLGINKDEVKQDN